MPSGGMAMTEGIVVAWLKEPGEPVIEGEPVVEIETDKANAEIESPVSGILGEHRFAAGDVVPVGEALTTVLESAEFALKLPDAARVQHRSEASAVAKPPSSEDSGSRLGTEAGTSGTKTREGHRLSPRARRAARQDPRANQRDLREIISKKVSESWRNAPHFAVRREIVADRLLAVRATLQQEFSVEVTLTDLLLRAVALSVPESWSHDGINIGLAVGTPRGVVIPVIRDVLNKDWAQLSAERERARTRAVDQRLSPADLNIVPSISLSNLGAFGVDEFTGIIPLGQKALLTVGTIRERVVAEGGTAVVRPTIIATLNVDHRALDGVETAEILAAFAVIVAEGEP